MVSLSAGLGWPRPPGWWVGLVPGQDHLMLMGRNRTLRAGQRVAITLRFAHAAPLTVEAPVIPLSQVADGMGSERASMGNMNMAGQ